MNMWAAAVVRMRLAVRASMRGQFMVPVNSEWHTAHRAAPPEPDSVHHPRQFISNGRTELNGKEPTDTPFELALCAPCPTWICAPRYQQYGKEMRNTHTKNLVLTQMRPKGPEITADLDFEHAANPAIRGHPDEAARPIDWNERRAYLPESTVFEDVTIPPRAHAPRHRRPQRRVYLAHIKPPERLAARRARALEPLYVPSHAERSAGASIHGNPGKEMPRNGNEWEAYRRESSFSDGCSKIA
ncbi:hypothetical protein FB451DRAFT_1176042 [Mycena latifolia]|nr:hypothetical protein FB451DRAFT_1176042 [Mycena latifolia]